MEIYNPSTPNGLIRQLTGQRSPATAGMKDIGYNPFGQQQAGYQLAGLNGTIAQGPIGTRPQGSGIPTGIHFADFTSVSLSMHHRYTSPQTRHAIAKKLLRQHRPPKNHRVSNC